MFIIIIYFFYIYFFIIVLLISTGKALHLKSYSSIILTVKQLHI